MGPSWRSTWRVTLPSKAAPLPRSALPSCGMAGFCMFPPNTDLTRPVHLVFVTTSEAAGALPILAI